VCCSAIFWGSALYVNKSLQILSRARARSHSSTPSLFLFLLSSIPSSLPPFLAIAHCLALTSALACSRPHSHYHPATPCKTLQNTAKHCNTPQHTAMHTATYCNTQQCTLQHTAAHSNTHCNILQHTAMHTATYCNTLSLSLSRSRSRSRSCSRALALLLLCARPRKTVCSRVLSQYFTELKETSAKKHTATMLQQVQRATILVQRTARHFLLRTATHCLAAARQICF